MQTNVPAEFDTSAGTLAFSIAATIALIGVLHHIAVTNASTRAGFIHVPYLEAQVLDKPDTASMSLATMIIGAKAAIMAAIKNKTDLKLSGGALD